MLPLKPTMYMDTSVVSYYTSRHSRDIISIANKQITAEWWEKVPGKYEIVISEAVIEEAAAGDREAAQKRGEALRGFRILEMNDDVVELAKRFQEILPIPEKAFGDVLHLAFCSIYKIDFLATWNCTHIANARIIRALQNWNREHGYHTPVICSPYAFLEELP